MMNRNRAKIRAEIRSFPLMLAAAAAGGFLV